MPKSCRFGCNDKGKYFQNGRLVPCPDHVELRREEVRNGEIAVNGDLVPLSKAVGMSPRQWHTYNMSQIIPDSARVRSKEGLPELLEGVDEVHRALVSGDSLEDSYCFGLPTGTRALQLGFSFLVDAYKNGQSIAPMVSSQQHHTFLHKDPERVSDKSIYFAELARYEGIYTSDLLVVNVASGGNSSVIDTAKGIMQSRAMSGLPTVFITTKPKNDLYEITEGDEQFYSARGYFVRYAREHSDDVELTTDPRPSTTLDDLETRTNSVGGREALKFNHGTTQL